MTAPATPASLPAIATDNSAAPSEKPYVVIRAGQRDLAHEFREMLRFRDLLWALAMRDVRLRYKQTILGAAWVVIQPLMAAGIFTLVFGLIAGLKSGKEGLPYFVFSYAGLLGWNLFANALGRLSSCLLGNGHLISKVYFPRLILPFSSFPGLFLDFGVAAVMMGALMIWFQINPGLAILTFPLWLLLLISLAFGVGLLAGSLAISYRDVNYILPVVTNLLMYGSPVAWTVATVAEKYRPYLSLNPLLAPLEGLRWSLLGTTPPPMSALIVSLVTALVVNLVGIFVFKSMERKFADVI